MASVHQFHSGTATGDAITGDMLEIQRTLRTAGYASDIFAEHIPPELNNVVRPISEYIGDSHSLLIVHHSMGFDGIQQVLTLPDRKILKYHNITPPEYLPLSMRPHAEKGLLQLEQYRERVELGVGDSDFNRRELVELGYRYTDVLPIFVRHTTLASEKPDSRLLSRLRGTWNLLFVGRICRNKKQDDLVDIFERYWTKYNPEARLHLLGSWSGCEEFADEVRAKIQRKKLGDVVSVAGKVSSAELAAHYRAASVLLCASEHEGFCVPLLEAMSFGVPVVAYAAAAVPETMGDAGILLDEKDPELWCRSIEELRTNSDFRAEILANQWQRLADIDVVHAERKLLEMVKGLELCAPIRPSAPTVQVQGPFETSYSLALINRNLAHAIDKASAFDVSIYCTEGPGDYIPRSEDLLDKPAARWLWHKSKMLSTQPDVVIRNLYPPRVHDASGKLNVLYFFWEDSLINPEWAQDFNQSLNAVLAPSKHVERVLRDSGVTVPIHVIGAGIEDRFFEPLSALPYPTAANAFVFLNIGSGFPRKGIDVLLNAYFTEFTAGDNTCLLLKTFPNIHNDVAQQLEAWRTKTVSAPRCIHINRDIPPGEIDQLYAAASCLVYPSRAEGFGLPIAEAMARRIPVIATAYGGHLDFCSPQTAYLIDFKLAPSGSHLNVPGAQWAEPHVGQLRQHMRYIFENRYSEDVLRVVDRAYQNVATHLRWSAVANKTNKAIAEHIASAGNRRQTSKAAGPKLAMVTSWDARCGIAEYTRYFVEALVRKAPKVDVEILSSPGEGVWPDSSFLNTVCWDERGLGNLDELPRHVQEIGADIVHFQFNFGFFDLDDLARAIRELKADRRKVVITFHSTADVKTDRETISLSSVATDLAGADLLLVHSIEDRQRLSTFGVADNVRILPHGNVVFPQEDRKLRKQWGITLDPLVSTFGFLLPHKGTIELLQALVILRADYPKIGLIAQCALHRDAISQRFETEVRECIHSLGLESSVLLSTEFVSPAEAALILQLSDMVVLPYKQTGESSSAAVRFALASGRPVLTSKSPIFADISDSLYQIDSPTPMAIAAAIRDVIAHSELASKLASSATAQAESSSWDRVAELFLESLIGRNMPREASQQTRHLVVSALGAQSAAAQISGPAVPVRDTEVRRVEMPVRPEQPNIEARADSLSITATPSKLEWNCKQSEAVAPSLSRLIRTHDWSNPRFAATASALHIPKLSLHRKYWEYVSIVHALEDLGVLDEDKVGLGLGTGAEVLCFYFANRGKQVYATDLFSSDAWDSAAFTVDSAYERSPFPYARERLKFLNMDMRNIELPSASVDYIWSCSSVEHVPSVKDYKKVYQGISRVLKPGGVAAIVTEFNLDVKPAYVPDLVMCDVPLLNQVENATDLRLIGELDLTVDDDPYNTPMPLDRLPYLPSFMHLPNIWADTGDHLLTSGIVVWKKDESLPRLRVAHGLNREVVGKYRAIGRAFKRTLTTQLLPRMDLATIGAYSNATGRPSLTSNGEDGALAFGPSLPLPAGRYEVRFRLRVDQLPGRPPQSVAMLDVFSGSLLARCAVPSSQRTGSEFSIHLSFDARPDMGHEFRVKAVKGCCITYFGATVYPIGGE
jgi:glycosyltransferase involved in cell wall biosynthesis/SAM-dependent methyltransferase